MTTQPALRLHYWRYCKTVIVITIITIMIAVFYIIIIFTSSLHCQLGTLAELWSFLQEHTGLLPYTWLYVLKKQQGLALTKVFISLSQKVYHQKRMLTGAEHMPFQATMHSNKLTKIGEVNFNWLPFSHVSSSINFR